MQSDLNQVGSEPDLVVKKTKGGRTRDGIWDETLLIDESQVICKTCRGTIHNNGLFKKVERVRRHMEKFHLQILLQYPVSTPKRKKLKNDPNVELLTGVSGGGGPSDYMKQEQLQQQQQRLHQQNQRANRNFNGNGTGTGFLPSLSVREQENFELELGKWVYSSGISMDDVEHPNFVRMLEILRPDVKVPSREKMETSLLQKCNGGIQKIKRELFMLSDRSEENCPPSQDQCVLLYPSQIPTTHPIHQLPGTALIQLVNLESPQNNMTGRMMAQLSDAVTELEKQYQRQNVTILVIEGTSEYFCGGANLDKVREYAGTEMGAKAISAVMVDILTRLRKLPVLSIALLEGPAIGGGAELACACDFRIMKDTSYMQFKNHSMEFAAGWGGRVHLVKLIGRQRALRFLAGSEKVGYQACIDAGLADGLCTSQEKIQIVAYNFICQFASQESEVIHSAKQAVAGSDDLTFERALESEMDFFWSLCGKPIKKKSLKRPRKGVVRI